MSAAYCRLAPGDPIHGPYDDTEDGFPAEEESVLFERLMLEINQAGLCWATILKKRAAFRSTYADFSVDRVDAFGPAEIERLLAGPGIIRHRLKIEAAIANARRVQALRQSHGSFALWLEAHHPRSPEAWAQLFRRTFRFSGGQIVGKFLISIECLPGSARSGLPGLLRILERSPPWRRAPRV